MSNETITRPRLAIIKNHFDDETTIIHGKYIFTLGFMIDTTDRKQVSELFEHQCDNGVKNGSIEINWQSIDEALAKPQTTDYKASEVSFFAYTYCRSVKNTKEMRQLIIDAKCSVSALQYIRFIEHDNDMRKVILDSKDPYSAFMYIRRVKNIKMMSNIIIKTQSAKYACEYCCIISNDKNMHQVIIDAQSAEYAYNLIKRLALKGALHDVMYQVILDAKDPKYAYLYAKNIKRTKSLVNVIINANSSKYAYLYCRDIVKTADLQAIIRKP